MIGVGFTINIEMIWFLSSGKAISQGRDKHTHMMGSII